MSKVADSPLTRLTGRLAREPAQQEERRAQLEPLQTRRQQLITQIEDCLTRFVAGAVPEMTPELLQPFEKAATDIFSDLRPIALLSTLQAQTISAAQKCQRYERDHNIYQIAEELPLAERRVASCQQRLAATQRSLIRVQQQLDMVERFSEYPSLPIHKRVWRFLTDHHYRASLSAISSYPSVVEMINAREALQQTLVVREQEAELQETELMKQRFWVDAYIEANAQKLSSKQLKAAVQQALVDEMHNPAYRTALAKHFGRRFPAYVEEFYSSLAEVDAQIRAFFSPHAKFSEVAQP